MRTHITALIIMVMKKDEWVKVAIGRRSSIQKMHINTVKDRVGRSRQDSPWAH